VKGGAGERRPQPKPRRESSQQENERFKHWRVSFRFRIFAASTATMSNLHEATDLDNQPCGNLSDNIRIKWFQPVEGI